MPLPPTLTRIATPWLVDEVTWSDELTERAVVWLSLRTGRAILKLTGQDYVGPSPVVAARQHGSAGDVNGHVFNRLGARIRGRSKLPAGRRIICFSPHPDDDVISMGGTLRKLVLNKNDITVAYMTSGNVAVFDHDVRRYLDWLVRIAASAAVRPSSVLALRERVHVVPRRQAARRRRHAEVLDLKRAIREAEAVSGLEVDRPDDVAKRVSSTFRSTGRVACARTRSATRTCASSGSSSRSGGRT